MYDKGELHLMLTSFNSPFCDHFFKIVTEIGGSVPIIVGVLFILYEFGASLYILVTQLINLLITSSLKLYFGVPRPARFFFENFPEIALHEVEGITMRMANSFPSGHTSAAFAMMLCIALISKNKVFSVACCFIAILVGYSRIYLSQHFAEDVLFGSIIGVVSALALYPFYEKLTASRRWSTQSIVSVFTDRNNADDK